MSEGPYEALIVGAGLAGGAMALRLARRGVRVALVDAAAFPRPKLCGEYLSPEGVAALDRLGIGPTGGEPIHRVRVTTTRGRVLEADVGGPDGLAGLGLTRSTLDDLIMRSAIEAGAVWMPATRVGGPIIEDGRVIGVTARSQAAGPIEVRARLVIAADGRNSALVQRTGVVRARSRFRPAHFGLKRHLSIADSAADEPPGCVGLHLVPGGYVGACRVEGGATNVCGLLPEALLKQSRGDLDALAEAHFRTNPALDALWRAGRPLDDWKTVAGVRVQSARPALGGVLYLGDCRGTVDPLGGQGMTMALLGAELAEPSALGMIQSTDDSLAIHRRYERGWHRRFDQRVRTCMMMHEMLVRGWPIGLGARLGPIGRGGLRLARSTTGR